jgi:hypothetical protein
MYYVVQVADHPIATIGRKEGQYILPCYINLSGVLPHAIVTTILMSNSKFGQHLLCLKAQPLLA